MSLEIIFIFSMKIILNRKKYIKKLLIIKILNQLVAN